MKKLLLSGVLVLLDTFCSAQQNATINYSLLSRINKNEISKIEKSNSTAIYDFDLMKITIIRNDKRDSYKIVSDVKQGISNSGEEYSEVLTKKGQDKFLIRLLSNRVMVIRMDSRTGIVLYN